MGICSSTSSIQTATAKLILEDGRLEEYPYPVKASYVLAKRDNSCFIADSDDMDFDGVVTAVDDDDHLLPGQLYFALPLTRLRTKLLAEDMAALALKASSALMKSAGGGGGGADVCGFRRSSVSPAPGSAEKGVPMGSRASRAAVGRGRRRGRGKFTAMLSSIPE